MMKEVYIKILFLFFTLKDMPEEVNIDELLELPSDETRTQKLQVP